MKATLPAVPHTTRLQIYRDDAGRPYPAVLVEFSAPSRFLALLPENDGIHCIPAAGLGTLEIVERRARRWNSGVVIYGKKTRPKREHLEDAVREGCDSTMRVLLSPDEWHLVGIICGRLKITPGQWFLGAAGYNASVEESHMDQILAALPAAV